MGMFWKTCAKAKHDFWKSRYTLLVNLNGKIGKSNVFFTAFKQKDGKRPRLNFCTNCLKKCWEKC